MDALRDFALVAAGGAAGAAGRFLVSRLSQAAFGSSFPWGTLIVNLAGCFLIGFALGLAERGFGGAALKPLAVAGFLGGLTTFSSFAYETVDLARRGAWGRAAASFAMNNLGALALATLGLAAALALGEVLAGRRA